MNGRWPLARPARTLLAARLALLTVAATGSAGLGCAKRIGEQAAAGAIQTLQAQAAQDPSRQPVRIAGERATIGVIDALDSPEQQARIRALVAEMSREAAGAAVDGATRRLFAQMGADGHGPLA